MSARLQLALIPRDGLFCKDGRGWHTSSAGRGHALDWPWPSTILGALRTVWGRVQEARILRRFERHEWPTRTAAVALGTTFALRRRLGVPWSVKDRVWPVPADALWLEGREDVFRLDPREPGIATLGIDEDEAREALWVSAVDDAVKPLRPPRWWCEDHMAAWLTGGVVVAASEAGSLRSHRRIEAHVGIRPETLTADDGILFSHDVIETLEPEAEWAIGVDVEMEGELEPTISTIGSDGRLARVEPIATAMFEPPDVLTDAFRAGCPGLRLIVVSPTEFADGWRPDGFTAIGLEIRGELCGIEGELILRAAMVPRPVHVSGWEMAADNGRGSPKEASRMVAPGAVYFFERVNGQAFDDADARQLWLSTMGSRISEGFGRVVPGTWFPKRSAL